MGVMYSYPRVARRDFGDCKMVRLLVRIFVSPLAIAVIDLLILIPLILAIVDVSQDLLRGANIHEPMDIVEGMGVILIGWGVALEERALLREIFALKQEKDEAWQVAIDHLCHSAGVGLLVFGLFAEMGIEVIRLPDRIINTQGANEAIAAVSVAFLAIGAYVQGRHMLSLFGATIQGTRAVPNLSDPH
jgi:hypothetical protein